MTAGGGLAIAARVNLPALSFSDRYVTTLAEEARFTSGSVVYYFTSDTGTALAADQAAVNDPNGYWLDASAVTAANLGYKDRLERRGAVPIQRILGRERRYWLEEFWRPNRHLDHHQLQPRQWPGGAFLPARLARACR